MRLKAGEAFDELAKSTSDDSGSGRNGGELPGWAPRGQLVPPFERAAFALKIGEFSEIIRTRFGFHIIKLLDYRKAAPQEFKEVEQQIIAKLRTEYREARRDEIVGQFAGNSSVEIAPVFLDAVKAN